MNAAVIEWMVEQALTKPRVVITSIHCSTGARQLALWAGTVARFCVHGAAHHFGWSSSHAQRLIRELVDAGILRPIHEDNRNFYELIN